MEKWIIEVLQFVVVGIEHDIEVEYTTNGKTSTKAPNDGRRSKTFMGNEPKRGNIVQ